MTDAEIKATYGFMAWALDIPELANILRTAAAQGWDKPRLEGAISSTAWWRTTQESARRWTALKGADPATAHSERTKRISEITKAASQFGVTLQTERIREIAERSLSLGWDADQLRSAIAFEGEYDPQKAALGAMSEVTSSVRRQASDYGVMISENSVGNWARLITAGTSTKEELNAYLREQAKLLAPGASKFLDQGLTTRQIFDQYAQHAASVLNIDPSTIDLSDPKWLRPLNQENGSMMTVDQWVRTIKTDDQYGYDLTDGAKREAAQFTGWLGKTFGVAA